MIDNSKSMLLYSDAMKKTLRHLVTISSLLLPKGITIRFLNTNHDGKDLYENITEGYQVDKICQNAKYFRFRNGPELGDFVNEDIIHPMIMRKARAGELKRPVITIMLTDADVRNSQYNNNVRLSTFMLTYFGFNKIDTFSSRSRDIQIMHPLL